MGRPRTGPSRPTGVVPAGTRGPGRRVMPDGVDEARLRRLLGGEHTAWLLDRVRRRLAQGRPLTGTVTLATADLDQRRAAERLLGRRAGAGPALALPVARVW